MFIEFSSFSWVIIMEWITTKRMKEENHSNLGYKFRLKYDVQANKDPLKSQGQKRVFTQGLRENNKKSRKISDKGDPSRNHQITFIPNPNSFPSEDLTQIDSASGIQDPSYVGPFNEIYSNVYQPYPSMFQESGPNFFNEGPLGFSQGPSDSRTVHSTYQGSQAWNQMGSSSGMHNPVDQQWNTFVSPSSPSTSRGMCIYIFFTS
ncbi:hypothetical protein HMI54_011777 [Coelomomyces lativittatus]|nr:hypothetical protein HMI54_011777 [Coelomomyces lativittatus]